MAPRAGGDAQGAELAQRGSDAPRGLLSPGPRGRHDQPPAQRLQQRRVPLWIQGHARKLRRQAAEQAGRRRRRQRANLGRAGDGGAHVRQQRAALARVGQDERDARPR
jgi:hypothetical protein